MKKLNRSILVLLVLAAASCSSRDEVTTSTEPAAEASAQPAGQSGVQDDESSPNVVQIAAGSKDHTTLVKAVQAAGLVDALSNAGPFTVFAPVNEAFAKLPAGTVEGLLAPDKKDDLKNILEYHVSVGVYKAESLRDNQNLGQVNGGNVVVKMVNGVAMLNGKAKILASIPASNGIIHVIDEVLLPQ
jgi:uncharacterized surface protein with fasciclin (FAS1) repeats